MHNLSLTLDIWPWKLNNHNQLLVSVIRIQTEETAGTGTNLISLFFQRQTASIGACDRMTQ
jgi:hypothetical protein